MNNQVNTEGSPTTCLLANIGSGNISLDSNISKDKKISTELIKMSCRMRKKKHLPEDLQAMSFWNQDKVLENC